MSDYIDIVFNGPPGHEPGRFVEVEGPGEVGASIGEWIDRGNGLWALRIPLGDQAGRDLSRLGGPDPDAGLWAELARLAGVEDGCSVPHAIVVGLIRRSLEQLREDWHRERCLRVECAQSAVGLVRWVRDGGHWDSRAGEPYPVDYACPQCRPSSDTLGDGSFVCAWHRAERIESACPAEPPSHDPEVQG